MIFVLLLFLGLICYVDIKTKIIGDGLTLLGIMVALNWQCFTGNIEMAVVGMTVGVLTVFVFNQVSGAIVGGGDCKVMGLIGSVIGWQVVFVFALSKVLCWGYRRVKNDYNTLAYAPFIFVAFIGVISSKEIFYFVM